MFTLKRRREYRYDDTEVLVHIEDYSYLLFQFAPFVLTPSLYPRKEFEKAINLQTVLNELTHNVAHDVKFLRETLASTIKVDDFTAALFRIYETVLAEGAAQVRNSVFLLSNIASPMIPRQDLQAKV